MIYHDLPVFEIVIFHFATLNDHNRKNWEFMWDSPNDFSDFPLWHMRIKIRVRLDWLVEDLPRVGTESRENEENDDTNIRIMLPSGYLTYPWYRWPIYRWFSQLETSIYGYVK